VLEPSVEAITEPAGRSVLEPGRALAVACDQVETLVAIRRARSAERPERGAVLPVLTRTTLFPTGASDRP